MGFRKNSRDTEAAGSSPSAESAGGVAVAEAPTRKAKKRKPHELLSSVVKESTVGAAVALMQENTHFSLPDGRSWVVLGLRVEGIGGLSMKQKNDETKGSIIELITADEITTVATAEMLETETFGIIPSEKTLGRMEEFNLLKKAGYVWVVMTKTADGTLAAEPIAETTYAEAVEISAGRVDLGKVMPEVWAWAGGTEDAVGAVEDEPFAAALVDAVSGTDEPLLGGTDTFDAGDNDPFGTNVALTEDEPVDYGALAAEEFKADDGGVDFGELEKQFADDTGSLEDAPAFVEHEVFAEPAPVDDRVFDEAQVRSSIARRFLSSDLDLQVSLEAFEANFASGAPVITFPVDEHATDWLGQQVNLLARQANTELAQLHRNNLDELREFWVSLMSRHTEQVIADVSPDREGSYYNRLLVAAKEDLHERRRKAPEEVSAQRQELVDRYESEASARGRQAAEQAVARYKDQNRARLERELAEVGLVNEQASEDFFDGAKKIILETRRRDAEARMDLGMTKVMEVVIERQQSHRDAEEALLRGWSERMTQLLDDNRKNDIARSEALAEQLSRSQQIEELNAQHAAHVAELRREQADKIAELDGNMRRAREDAVNELAERERDWTAQLATERQNTEAANTRVQDLLNQFTTHSSVLDAQYANQIRTLKEDKQSYARQMKRTAKVQARANKVMVVLVVVLALAALLVGFVVGASIGTPSLGAVGIEPGLWTGGEGILSPA